MKIEAKTKDAYKLMHDGALCLADIERTGIRIDIDYCKQKRSRVLAKQKRLEKTLLKHKDVQRWKKRYGARFKLTSDKQLQILLYDMLGHKPTKANDGKKKVDENTLLDLEVSFADDLIKLRRNDKIANTYLAQLIRETVNGYVHPMYNLHLIVSYRSSADHPSWQNMPVRIREVARAIRQAVLAREGRSIGELDYKGLEVRSNTWYHQDPVMIAYIKDKTKDMHRDMAMELFKLNVKQVSKLTRYAAKNAFVFPEFYGSFHEQCALSLWRYIKRLSLERTDGMPLHEHLKEQRIGTFRAFGRHVERVERRFWNERFRVYNQWRKRHMREYLRRGYFDMLTGFRCSGAMKKNEAINYRGQGTAFHCLLWSLIQLHDWLTSNDFETLVLGQIHDSIINDFAPEEQSIVLANARKIMCEDIREHWNWISTPLEIEAEIAPPDTSWFEKKEVEIAETKSLKGENR